MENSDNDVVITTKKIISKELDILLVSHEDDGVWQVLNPNEILEEENSVVCSLDEIIAIDNSISSLKNIPNTFEAKRSVKKNEWIVIPLS